MSRIRESLRRGLLALGILGSLVAGGGLLTSYVAPLAIEQIARELIRLEVQQRVGDKIDALSDTRIADLARRALDKTGADADQVERSLREQLPQQVANAMADMLKVDCECRKRLAQRLQEAQEEKLGSLRQAQAQLSNWIERAYAHTRAQLLREFRIFTGAHALMFLTLAAMCLWRKQSTVQLALVAVTLLGASALVGGLYLFEQDWLHTIIFSQYVGWGYAAYLAGATAMFADIAFYKAKVTTLIIDSAFTVLGAASPC